MENSIEKDEEILNNIKTYMQENIDKGWHKFVYNDLGCHEKCIDIINAIETVLSELEKKDKIIDLMAEQLAGLAIFDIDKDEPLILGDKEEIKQYFKEKAEKGE